MRAEREYREVRFADVRVGDVYANHASVTEVLHGDEAVDRWGDRPGMHRNPVWIDCGGSFGCIGPATNRVVIGRFPHEWDPS